MRNAVFYISQFTSLPKVLAASGYFDTHDELLIFKTPRSEILARTSMTSGTPESPCSRGFTIVRRSAGAYCSLRVDLPAPHSRVGFKYTQILTSLTAQAASTSESEFSWIAAALIRDSLCASIRSLPEKCRSIGVAVV